MLHGRVPRSTYMPYPFQIVQGTGTIMIVYEYAAPSAYNMGAPTKAPADSWMGWSMGHWEGDSLVVDVTSLNDRPGSTGPGTCIAMPCT